jgi:hypothetical protein
MTDLKTSISPNFFTPGQGFDIGDIVRLSNGDTNKLYILISGPLPGMFAYNNNIFYFKAREVNSDSMWTLAEESIELVKKTTTRFTDLDF